MARILDVKCTNCKWKGKEDMLTVIRSRGENTEYCPKCGSSQYLQNNELEEFHNAVVGANRNL